MLKVRTLRTILSKIVKVEDVMLGRWQLDYNEQKLERKIRSANEDHCGVCDIETQNNEKQINYIKPYLICCRNNCPNCRFKSNPTMKIKI